MYDFDFENNEFQAKESFDKGASISEANGNQKNLIIF